MVANTVADVFCWFVTSFPSLFMRVLIFTQLCERMLTLLMSYLHSDLAITAKLLLCCPLQIATAVH